MKDSLLQITESLKSAFPGAVLDVSDYQGDVLVLVDKNVITSFNPSTAMDVAFLLLEKLTNKDNCNKVKHLMGC